MNQSKLLQFVRGAITHDGGVRAWQSESGDWVSVYPEVTGYIIPTLLNCGEPGLARRLGDYLLSIQSKGGAFAGLDGVHRAFDTAAALEGLWAFNKYQESSNYSDAIKLGADWLRAQFKPGEVVPVVSPSLPVSHIYNLRAAGIYHKITGRLELEPWGFAKMLDFYRAWLHEHPNERSHYLAYGLEGLALIAETASEKVLVISELKKAIKNGYREDAGAMGFALGADYAFTGGTDAPATAQFAALCLGLGMIEQGSQLLSGLDKYITADGGVTQAVEDRRRVLWGNKFCLDAICLSIELPAPMAEAPETPLKPKSPGTRGKGKPKPAIEQV